MMTLQIRIARPDDAQGMLRVLNPIIEAGSYTALDQPFTVDQQRAFITGFPQRGVFHVAERVDDGAIVGLQDVAPFSDEGTRAFDHVGVIATYVDLSLRRTGVSKQLFSATFEAARKKGFEKLFTYIRADNPAALAAYQHQGFQIIGTAKRQARIRGEFIDEVFVERFL